MTSSLVSILAIAFAATSLGIGQDEKPKEELDPQKVVADRALISVDRKHARGEGIGLWLRESDGKMHKVWAREPYDACSLVNRTILVVERWTGRVLWIDYEGEILFEKSGFRRPVDVELGPDDSIVVVENEMNRVVCIDTKTSKVRWTRTGFDGPFDACVLQDGGLLVADSGNGRVVELDKDGKTVRIIRGLGFPNTVERLPEGGMLISTWSNGEVIELDAKGKTVWKTRVGGTLYSAERRFDGLTVAADGANGRIFFLDAKGKVVKTERFEPGCVDYETIEEL